MVKNTSFLFHVIGPLVCVYITLRKKDVSNELPNEFGWLKTASSPFSGPDLEQATSSKIRLERGAVSAAGAWRGFGQQHLARRQPRGKNAADGGCTQVSEGRSASPRPNPPSRARAAWRPHGCRAGTHCGVQPSSFAAQERSPLPAPPPPRPSRLAKCDCVSLAEVRQRAPVSLPQVNSARCNGGTRSPRSHAQRFHLVQPLLNLSQRLPRCQA